MMANSTMLLSSLDWRSPVMWRAICTALLLVLSLAMSLPSGLRHSRRRRGLAVIFGLAGLALLWSSVPVVGTLTTEAGFACVAALTVGSAAATITSRSPVYSAICFAVSLLGTAGLLLLQNAQFLSVATIAVYAGAIVVTLLFVLMLAQPEGHAYYDRVSWGTAPRFVGALTAVVMAMLIAAAVTRPDKQVVAGRAAAMAAVQSLLDKELPEAKVCGVRQEADGDRRRVRVTVAVPGEHRGPFDEQAAQLATRGLELLQAEPGDTPPQEIVFEMQDLSSADHTAHLGAQLFSRQLIAIQAAGTLLLTALVGAVAIASRTAPAELGKTETLDQGQMR